MRQHVTRIAFLLCWVSVLASAQKTHPEALPGAVTGHVYCADTNGPGRFARILLQPVAHTTQNPELGDKDLSGGALSATSGLDGSFTIQNVQAGKYYVVGDLSGYRSAFADVSPEELREDSPKVRQRFDKLLQKIAVEPNQTTSVDIQLEKGAAMSGTVRYDEGSPGVNLSVRLYRKQKGEIWKTARANSSGLFNLMNAMGFDIQTDDRGHFREVGLPPGVYTIEAVLPVVQMSPSALFGEIHLNVHPTSASALQIYLGNTMRLSDAKALELGPGEERNDVDIVIPTTSLRVVRGAVIARRDGHGIAQGTVTLRDPSDKTILRETDIEEDGTFRFDYLPEGSYLVDVSRAADEAQGVSTHTYEPLSQPLLVQGDLDGLTLSLANQK